MIELKVINRSVVGKQVKQLRQQGLIPGNIVVRSKDSIPVSINQSELTKVLEKAGYTQPIKINLDQDQSLLALTTQVSRDPITDSYLHIVFQKIRRGDRMVINVPVEMEGQLSGEASNLILLQGSDTIEIETDPLSAPEKVVVDISHLETTDDVIRAGEIKLPEGAVLVGDDQDVIVRLERSKMQISDENKDLEIQDGEETDEGQSDDTDQTSTEDSQDDKESNQ